MAGVPVLWTWAATLVISVVIQRRVGLDWPSEGLVASSAVVPALLVAALPTRWRHVAAVVATGLSALVGTVNAAYHLVFGTYVPLRSFLLVGQGWGQRGFAFELLGPVDLVPFAIFLITLAVALGTRSMARSMAPHGYRGAWLVVCLLGLAPAVRWATVVAPTDMEPYTAGFIYDHMLDVRRIIGERQMGQAPPIEEMERMTRLLESRHVANGDDPWWGMAAGSNLLLIQVESFNGWTMGAEVDGVPVTPVLTSLAERGISFEWILDQTHGGHSSDADHLVMASQQPLEKDAVSMVRPGLDMEALADVLKKRGYTTLSAVGAVADFWNMDERYTRYGIDRMMFKRDFPTTEESGHWPANWPLDLPVMQTVASELSQLSEPWLAYVLTATMHAPHSSLPDGVPTIPLGELEGTPLGNYILKTRYTDAAIGVMLDSLRAAGDLAHTTVVVYGDHTDWTGLDVEWVEEFLAVQGHPADARTLLLDRVPLVIAPPPGSLPSRLQGTGVLRPGGLLDLGPTLLHLMGEEPPRWFLGRSLLAEHPSLVARASGEAVDDSLMWTGSGCYAFPSAEPRASDACVDLRARAREELEVSWLITMHGLSAAEAPAGGER